MSDAMSAASLICDVMQMHRMADQMDQRRERDAVIDELINRHNNLASTNAALQGDYDKLVEQYQQLAQDHERQCRRIKELEIQLEREREEARITIRDLKVEVQIMRPVYDKYERDWRLGR